MQEMSILSIVADNVFDIMGKVMVEFLLLNLFSNPTALAFLPPTEYDFLGFSFWTA